MSLFVPASDVLYSKKMRFCCIDKVNYNNTFNAKKYDRINLMVAKGKKDAIKEHAEKRGESTNAFINRAIDETIERDNA